MPTVDHAPLIAHEMKAQDKFFVVTPFVSRNERTFRISWPISFVSECIFKVSAPVLGRD